MDFDWARECLLGVENIAEHLGEHFVNTDVGQEQVVILEQIPLVLILLEVTL